MVMSHKTGMTKHEHLEDVDVDLVGAIQPASVSPNGHAPKGGVVKMEAGKNEGGEKSTGGSTLTTTSGVVQRLTFKVDNKALEPEAKTRKKLSRNESEKLRRDKLNCYIGELARTVPLITDSDKKIDKASILRLTVTYLKIHYGLLKETKDNLSDRMRADLKMFKNLGSQFLNAMGGFMLVINKKGILIFATEALTKHLGHRLDPEFNAPPGIGGTKKYRPAVGDFFLTLSRGFTADQPQYQPQYRPQDQPQLHASPQEPHSGSTTVSTAGSASENQTDVLGYKVFNIIDEKDVGMLMQQFEPAEQDSPMNLSSSSSASSSSSSDQIVVGQRSFYIRMLNVLDQQSTRYDLVHVKAFVRRKVSNTDQPMTAFTTAGASAGVRERSSDTCLIGVAKLVSHKPITELYPILNQSDDQWLTRHALDGSITFSDQRGALLTGFMPGESVGFSPYELIHPDDISDIVTIHNMYLTTRDLPFTAFRMYTKSREILYIRNNTHMVLDSWTHKPRFIININTVVNQEDGERDLEEQRQRLIRFREESNDLALTPFTYNHDQPSVGSSTSSDESVSSSEETVLSLDSDAVTSVVLDDKTLRVTVGVKKFCVDLTRGEVSLDSKSRNLPIDPCNIEAVFDTGDDSPSKIKRPRNVRPQFLGDEETSQDNQVQDIRRSIDSIESRGSSFSSHRSSVSHRQSSGMTERAHHPASSAMYNRANSYDHSSSNGTSLNKRTISKQKDSSFIPGRERLKSLDSLAHVKSLLHGDSEAALNMDRYLSGSDDDKSNMDVIKRLLACGANPQNSDRVRGRSNHSGDYQADGISNNSSQLLWKQQQQRQMEARRKAALNSAQDHFGAVKQNNSFPVSADPVRQMSGSRGVSTGSKRSWAESLASPDDLMQDIKPYIPNASSGEFISADFSFNPNHNHRAKIVSLDDDTSPERLQREPGMMKGRNRSRGLDRLSVRLAEAGRDETVRLMSHGISDPTTIFTISEEDERLASELLDDSSLMNQLLNYGVPSVPSNSQQNFISPDQSRSTVFQLQTPTVRGGGRASAAAGNGAGAHAAMGNGAGAYSAVGDRASLSSAAVRSGRSDAADFGARSSTDGFDTNGLFMRGGNGFSNSYNSNDINISELYDNGTVGQGRVGNGMYNSNNFNHDSSFSKLTLRGNISQNFAPNDEQFLLGSLDQTNNFDYSDSTGRDFSLVKHQSIISNPDDLMFDRNVPIKTEKQFNRDMTSDVNLFNRNSLKVSNYLPEQNNYPINAASWAGASNGTNGTFINSVDNNIIPIIPSNQSASETMAESRRNPVSQFMAPSPAASSVSQVNTDLLDLANDLIGIDYLDDINLDFA